MDSELQSGEEKRELATFQRLGLANKAKKYRGLMKIHQSREKTLKKEGGDLVVLQKLKKLRFLLGKMSNFKVESTEGCLPL